MTKRVTRSLRSVRHQRNASFAYFRIAFATVSLALYAYRKIIKMEVVAKKISKRSLFKILFIGTTFGFAVFFIGCGIGALFGLESVHWDDEPVTGVLGLIVAFAMWPFFTFFMSLFIWLFCILGLWLYSFFKPIKVTFKQPIEGNNEHSV